MNLTTTRRQRPGERGAALVEFAVVSIVFFVFVFGIIEFGRMIFDYNVVSAAARDGARYAALRGATSKSPVSAGEVRSYVAGRSFGRLSAEEVTVVWLAWDAASSRCGDTAGTNVPGNCVRVSAAQRFSPAVATFVPQAAGTLESTASLIVSR